MIRHSISIEPNDKIPDFEGKLRDWAKENSTQELDGCWNWKGSFDKNTNIARYKNSNANSYIYKKLNDCGNRGKILRSCSNPKCVNPDHSYHTIGAVSRRKIKMDLRMDQQDLTKGQRSVLKEDITSITKSAVSLALEESIKREVKHAVKTTIKAEFGGMVVELVDGVVAELIRIKFDEMIARKIK